MSSAQLSSGHRIYAWIFTKRSKTNLGGLLIVTVYHLNKPLRKSHRYKIQWPDIKIPITIWILMFHKASFWNQWSLGHVTHLIIFI